MAEKKKFKTAPASKESEMMVLGSMLTSQDSLNAAADMLEETDFYYGEHKIIFRALQEAFHKDRPADVHLISESLKKDDLLKEAGSISYLTTLAQYAGTSAYVEEYAKIIKDKSLLRCMISTSEKIIKKALADAAPAADVLDDAQAGFFNISQSINSNSFVNIKELLSGAKNSSNIPYLKELQEKQEEYLKKGPSASQITGMPTHFADLDKLINGLENSNLIILASRPAMGKCVTGDTLIIDPKTGALTPIKELVQKKSGNIVSLNKNWKLQKDSPSQYVADGIKPTFKLKTALGKEIEATAVHPLLTINGWKPLKELKKGDRIAVPRNLPFFGEQKWAEHKIKALAYFIADGCLTTANPSFTNVNSKIVADFKKSIFAFGSVYIRKEASNGRAPSYYVALDRKPLAELKNRFATAFKNLAREKKRKIGKLVEGLGLNKTLVYSWACAGGLPSSNTALALQEEFPELPSLVKAERSNPVTDWIKSLGLYGKNAHQKSLPKDVFELTKNNLTLFINRLFSCDGTAYVANCGGRPFPVIAYSSVSKLLIHQIQHLLLRFGIISSKVRSKTTTCSGKSFPSYELEIHGNSDLVNFCKEIGIYGKEEAVSRVLKQALSTPKGWTKDSMPLAVWDLIQAKKKKKGKQVWESLFKAKGLKFSSNLHVRKRSVRRDTLNKIAEALDDLELKQLANSDVYWDRIVSIESTGEKEVFDLTVEQTHNFVAGDIIVHNTAIALNIAENVCFKNKTPVAIFSLEMTAEQLLHRVICSQAEVESEKIKTGALNGQEYQRIVTSANLMMSGTMIIDDQPGLKITDLRARARRLKESHNIGFLVIDYLQLISGSNSFRSADNRQNEISEISRMLKTLARELDIPILCLSQLSRKVEERTGHRPMMSDLRESGCVTGDTQIKDAKTGKIHTIKELAERKKQTPITVYAVDEKLKVKKHKMTKAFSSGKKAVFELKTKSGRSIKASANHPFLKLEGWTRLDQLKVEDKIALPQKDNVIFDEITSITKLGIEEVYDATVEDVHNFVANDIMIHNSIEQDSDQVMFLLRREYYDPYDKPGQAELIIAKNRHGQVGSVNLSFRKELAQFANYSLADTSKENPAFAEFTPS